MAYKKRSERKRSYGGKAESGNQYNAQNSPEEKSEKAKSDGFKKGGHVEGMKGRSHLAKRARGGAMIGHNSKRSPMSSAHDTSAPMNGRESGPGEQAPVEP